LLNLAGAGSPRGFALGALILFLGAGATTFWAIRPFVSWPAALLAATVVCLHPAREQHLLWVSGGIDALCLVLSLLCLGVAARALRRDRCGAIVIVVLAVTTSLAVLCKEIALLLPLIVALLPGSTSRRHRMTCAAASALGLAIAGLATFAVLSGSSRAADLFGAAAPHALWLYPSRLIWPGDLETWLMAAKQDGSYSSLFAIALVTAVATGVLAWLWRSRIRSPCARIALLLILAGSLPWIIQQKDRGIGLGVVGVSLLIAGAALRRRDPSPWIASIVVVVLAASWAPLWLQQEADWTRASMLSRKVASSVREWKAEVGNGKLLVGIGGPSNVGWTCEVSGISEVYPCGFDLLSVIGPDPLTPLELEVNDRSARMRASSTGNTVLRWRGSAVTSVGVVEVRKDNAGYTRSAVLDPASWHPLAELRGCKGVDARVWDGEGFAPLPAGAADDIHQ